MSRLPNPGSDDGTWGTILNDYLSQSLTSGGALNTNAVGTTQLQDLAVIKAKLSSGVQTSLDKADSALQTAPVTSVSGKVGAVTLVAADVGAAATSHTHTASQVTDFTAAVSSNPAITAKDNRPTEVTVTTARTTAAKIGTTTSGTYIPSYGDRINVTFTLGCAVATPTMNIDGSGVKNIRLGEVNVSTTLMSTPAVSTKVPFWYDGTYWQMYGSQLNTDTNTTYPEISSADITAGTAATLGSITGRRSQEIVVKAQIGMASSSAITTHTSDTNNPHAVTKTQVGLANVDNTSDAGKPVSTAQQTALNLKLNTTDLDSQTATTINDVGSDTQTALAAAVSNYANLAAGSTITVTKSGGTWSSRPTSRADVVVIWKGADPSPSVVSSGTGGMLDNVDMRFITS